MTTKSSFSLALAITGILTALSASTHAALIVWAPPSNITGDTNVSTAGTLVGAYNVGDTFVGATGPINTVTFQPFALPTGVAVLSGVPGFTIQTTDAFFVSNNTIYGSNPAPVIPTPFSSLSANYQSLLRSGSETDDANSLELTMTGLLSGALYQFQFWSNFSGVGTALHSAVNPDSDFVDLSDNTSGTAGGLGQFTIGTFRAIGASESVTFTGGPDGVTGGLLNGFQLRQTAIPEPSTILFGVALAGVCFGRRKRVAKAGVSIA